MFSKPGSWNVPATSREAPLPSGQRPPAAPQQPDANERERAERDELHILHGFRGGLPLDHRQQMQIVETP
jgi:hypothetical protein